MTKYVFFALLLTTSWPSFAWSCPHVNNSYNFDIHWDAATDVFFGKIIEGKLDQSEPPEYEYHTGNILITVQIEQTYKGPKNGLVQLKSSNESIDPELAIGQNYMFFLYGDNVTDFCSLTSRAEIGYTPLQTYTDREYVRAVLKKWPSGHARELDLELIDE